MKKTLKVTRKVYSLRRRLMLIMVFGILVWCAVVIVIFRFSFRISENSRMENGMKSDIAQLTKQLDEDYYSLLKMSQQMTQEGSIGSAFDDYLQAKEPYDKIEESSNVTSSINTMIFNYDTGALASYFYLDGQKEIPLFSNLPVRDNPFAQPFPMLSKSNEIQFHSFHTCLNVLSDKQVISLIRKVNFSNGNYLIYAETHVGIEEMIRMFSASRDVSYTMLQPG